MATVIYTLNFETALVVSQCTKVIDSPKASTCILCFDLIFISFETQFEHEGTDSIIEFMFHSYTKAK